LTNWNGRLILRKPAGKVKKKEGGKELSCQRSKEKEKTGVLGSVEAL